MQLSHWSEFDAIRGKREQDWKVQMPEGLTTRINIFKARFDVAARIDSISFSPSFNDATAQAYLAGTRLLLAYSAGEAFMRAEDLLRGRKAVRITSWSISRASLARKMVPLAELLIEKSDSHGALNSSTKKYLKDFVAGEKSDVRPVATALRHVHTHGGLTARSVAGDSGSQGVDFVDCINELASALLERCDEKFSQMVKEIDSMLSGKS
ncbi:MAG: hypothetical protein EBZ48_15795 [Proteobacteria bacterium]|nr:hypothetical protein [Pseudomonadota bacterium]